MGGARHRVPVDAARLVQQYPDDGQADDAGQPGAQAAPAVSMMVRVPHVASSGWPWPSGRRVWMRGLWAGRLPAQAGKRRRKW
ncbi:Uncharacterised protein [Bordetella pertussis]|nr:Uncharacterised protein [Bordetella pertussis]